MLFIYLFLVVNTFSCIKKQRSTFTNFLISHLFGEMAGEVCCGRNKLVFSIWLCWDQNTILFSISPAYSDRPSTMGNTFSSQQEKDKDKGEDKDKHKHKVNLGTRFALRKCPDPRRKREITKWFYPGFWTNLGWRPQWMMKSNVLSAHFREEGTELVFTSQTKSKGNIGVFLCGKNL